MTYRRVLPISMVLAVLGSNPATALAAFPEDEFSEHEREWRHDRLGMQHNRRTLRQNESIVGHDGQQRPMDERHGPSAGQSKQDQQYRRHAGQELRHNRRDLRADRQNRTRNQREVRKERPELHRDRQDLRADHRGLRGESLFPSAAAPLKSELFNAASP